MERLPILGSEEHLQWCARADKGIRGDNYEKYTKPKRVKLKNRLGGLRGQSASPEIKARTLELWDTGKYRQAEVCSMIYQEKGFYLTKSALKNWVWLRNKEKRDEQNA